MSDIRLIQAVLSAPETGSVVLETTLSIARLFTAHFRVLHVLPNPALSIPLVGEAMLGNMIEDTMRTCEEQGHRKRDVLKKLFDQWTCDRQVPVVSDPQVASYPTVSWHEAIGIEDDVAANLGRLCDLSVVGLPIAGEEDPWLEATLNNVLMESGRPILVPPRTAPTHIGTRIVIAWNGSQESTRAVHAALPLLKRADVVTILALQDEDAPPLQNLAPWLALHGVRAETQQLGPPGITGEKIGEALLRTVSSCRADLLVMGAFGHSRLRQLILGGVTRHVLDHAEVPLFMRH